MPGVMRYIGLIKFILSHTWLAAAATLLFAAGAMCAMPVLRWRIRPLLILPEWLALRLQSIIEATPSVVGLGLFIFAFNGSAMFLYMLTGVLPGMPALIVFLTGLHVALAALISQRRGPQPPAAPRHLPALARTCAGLTFLLELPCFWYTMAMSWTLRAGMTGEWQRVTMNAIRERATAYLLVILPVLAVSALAEAYAVTSATRGAAPPPDG